MIWHSQLSANKDLQLWGVHLNTHVTDGLKQLWDYKQNGFLILLGT